MTKETKELLILLSIFAVAILFSRIEIIVKFVWYLTHVY